MSYFKIYFLTYLIHTLTPIAHNSALLGCGKVDELAVGDCAHEFMFVSYFDAFLVTELLYLWSK